ncbi:Uncharacterised protein [Leclercia adecarboxylata]|uniref:Uncharacterized protein n=1 Tax=Leclercia adecarboxylata TaxID=83655 RepID=A0A4U9HEQ7_9ENTR|nr:Uncharacterised protein [Leclercia adecarboxylata]
MVTGHGRTVVWGESSLMSSVICSAIPRSCGWWSNSSLSTGEIGLLAKGDGRAPFA